MPYKVALVTGVAAGIGAACAETVDAIESAGGTAVAVAADVSNRQQVRAAIEEVQEALGPITILVNNAGIVEFIPFEDITDEGWDRMFAVNCRGLFIVTQEVLPDMKAAGWGRIVNISSSSAQTGTKVQVHYSASKGAILTFTRSLAEALGPDGITVNNIPPGSVMGTIMSEANRAQFPRTSPIPAHSCATMRRATSPARRWA